jgi:methylmalonyl-CoA mutase N-terminal domain/subunit
MRYVEAAVKKGQDPNEFGKRLSFFLQRAQRLLEEVAKFRAARRLWAKIMKERFGVTDKGAQMLRFHTQTAGSTLTAQQPENNIVRVAVQTLAAVLGGTQSLHTNSYDEALALPTEKSVGIALKTQQIVAYESGVTETVDPLAGSYVVETLTNEIERQAAEYIAKIDGMAGCCRHREGIRAAADPGRGVRDAEGDREGRADRGGREQVPVEEMLGACAAEGGRIGGSAQVKKLECDEGGA